MRRYNRWWSRFDQPDPYDGSYNLTDGRRGQLMSYGQVEVWRPKKNFRSPASEKFLLRLSLS